MASNDSHLWALAGLKNRLEVQFVPPVGSTDLASLKARLARKPHPSRVIPPIPPIPPMVSFFPAESTTRTRSQVIEGGSGHIQVGGDLVVNVPVRSQNTAVVWSDMGYNPVVGERGPGYNASVCLHGGHYWVVTEVDVSRDCIRCGLRQTTTPSQPDPQSPKAWKWRALPSPQEHLAEQERQLNEELGIRAHDDVTTALARRPSPEASVWTLVKYLVRLWWSKLW